MTVPWLVRMTALLGLYEIPGTADNPVILEMAKFCGGKIAQNYVHDSIPWCALATNYCLLSSGFSGNDSLWALDFRKYGVKLSGPAVGAIASKEREGGGHVFLVVGRSSDGKIVGRGGNQANMVSDELFEPSTLNYNWPDSYASPEVGYASLPVVTPEAAVRRIVSLSDIGAKEQPSLNVNIVATVFGGKADNETSSYTGEVIDDDIVGVALPYKFRGLRPKVRVAYAGKSVVADVVDVGPWNINDPYWETHARPQAEGGKDNTGRTTNRAGIDLTPAAARAIGLDGKGVVNWQFVTQPVPKDIQKAEPKKRPEAKPAIKSHEIWAYLISLITALGATLTDWHFLVFVVFIAVAYGIWRRFGRGDISGLFK